MAGVRLSTVWLCFNSTLSSILLTRTQWCWKRLRNKYLNFIFVYIIDKKLLVKRKNLVSLCKVKIKKNINTLHHIALSHSYLMSNYFGIPIPCLTYHQVKKSTLFHSIPVLGNKDFHCFMHSYAIDFYSKKNLKVM